MNDLKKALEEAQALHIADVMCCLKKDPTVELHYMNYSKTTEYLNELIEKDGSVMTGIIRALECYLEK